MAVIRRLLPPRRHRICGGGWRVFAFWAGVVVVVGDLGSIVFARVGVSVSVGSLWLPTYRIVGCPRPTWSPHAAWTAPLVVAKSAPGNPTTRGKRRLRSRRPVPSRTQWNQWDKDEQGRQQRRRKTKATLPLRRYKDGEEETEKPICVYVRTQFIYSRVS